jgi:glycogen debranching enzyme
MNGDVPIHTRGCYTQAWSVGEILRAYYENYLRKEV